MFYRNDIENLSIDTMTDMRDALKESLSKIVLGKHIEVMHHGEQLDFFDAISGKINQFAEGFDAFQLTPAEFERT